MASSSNSTSQNPAVEVPFSQTFKSKLYDGLARLAAFPAYAKENYYDGWNKYKTLAIGIGVISVWHYVRKFYRSIIEADKGHQSFVRGLVETYWIPILGDFRILDLNAGTYRRRNRHAAALTNPITWFYADYDDMAVDNHDLEKDLGLLVEDDRDVPPEVTYLLKATQVLGQFNTVDMVQLWKSVETMQIEMGEVLFTQGDPDDQIYILIGGLMEIRTTNFESKPVVLKTVSPGGQLYSILSFVDVITGNSRPIKTVEAVALENSLVMRIPSEAIRAIWMHDLIQMRRSLRRLVRRVYQVVFIALHTVLGLTTELLTNEVGSDRPPIDPALFSITTITNSIRMTALFALMDFFGLRENVKTSELSPLLTDARVALVQDGYELLRAGSKSSTFVYVYKGEMEVSRIVGFDGREEIEHEQIMFYVSEGQGIGGLSYITDDVNIFNVRVPVKAIIVIIQEENLEKLCELHPKCHLPIANSIVRKLSSFTRQIDFGIDWIHVDSSSAPIYRVDEEADSTYLVLSGRLRSILYDRGNKQIIGEYGRNDWIGLVETLTKKRRSKTVLSVRDSELARIPEGVLNVIKLRFPIVTIRLLDFLGHRVAKTYRSGKQTDEGRTEEMLNALEASKRGCSTITLLPCTNGIPVFAIAHEIRRCYEPFGTARILQVHDALKQFGPDALSRSHDYLLSSWFALQEESNELVIYVSEPVVSQWSLRCVRQADTVLILVNSDESCLVSSLENLARIHAPRARKELVILHYYRLRPTTASYMPSRGLPRRTRNWLELRTYLSFHHHIRLFPSHMCLLYEDEARTKAYYEEEWSYNIHSDFSRLVRWISGNSAAVVLGGGGAKGAAHIGLLQAILEHGMPIDLIAGVSIGAFVGALYASFQDVTRVNEYCQDWFLHMTKVHKYILDMTFPYVSFLQGEAFNESLKTTFGDIQIEDLWLPYFCLSTDVTGSGPRLHQCGSLWKYCRASMTLAGYFPPMVDPVDGHYLMDGGYTNLVPANLMRDFGGKYIVAFDVSSEDDTGTTNFGEHLSGLRVLAHKYLPFLQEIRVPHLFQLQSQLSFIQSALYMEMVKKMDAATMYLRPPIAHWTSGDFGEYKPIKYTGYRYASEVFQNVQPEDSLLDQWLSIKDHVHLIHDIDAVNAFKKPEEGEPTDPVVRPTTVRFQPSRTKSLGTGLYEQTRTSIRRKTLLFSD